MDQPATSTPYWAEVVRLFVNLGVLERILYLCARFSGRIYDNELLRLVIPHIPSTSRRIGIRVTTDGHNELSATEVVRPISSRNPRMRVIESRSNTDLWTSLWDYALLAQDFEMPPWAWGDVSQHSDRDFPCLQTLTIVDAGTIMTMTILQVGAGRIRTSECCA
ncbi:hypothetical protein EXIGLDRAFT_760099 [Exidia glandulosa HHB12029]|uniref:Uncharacterized protein n=1 Tax=Exidia glandulosa HHB12029 TaxID=1314781 RepID=A0A165PJJ2_EXIGL|nr:hypothetical protein EXIGLDRAFT_760099 [Exidia glandulosa HHB12029]